MARPGAASRLFRLVFQREILSVAAIGKGKAFPYQDGGHVAPIRIADREFARVSIGEFRIDAAGEVGSADKLAQPFGCGLAAGPLDVMRIKAGLLAFERVGALEPKALGGTAEFQDRIDAALGQQYECVTIDHDIAIDGRRFA